MEVVKYEDFKRLDLRVGKVTKAERIPGKSKILKLLVDIGDEVRNVIVGGAEYYDPDYFVGKLVVLVANLEPKVIAGIKSEGMVLAADYKGRPYWLTVDGNVPPGVKIR